MHEGGEFFVTVQDWVVVEPPLVAVAERTLLALSAELAMVCEFVEPANGLPLSDQLIVQPPPLVLTRKFVVAEAEAGTLTVAEVGTDPVITQVDCTATTHEQTAVS